MLESALNTTVITLSTDVKTGGVVCPQNLKLIKKIVFIIEKRGEY